jgi:hypothetical protein
VAQNDRREGVYIRESFGELIGDFFNQPYLESKLNSTDLVWIHLGIKPIQFLMQTPLLGVESDSGSTISKSSTCKAAPA